LKSLRAYFFTVVFFISRQLAVNICLEPKIEAQPQQPLFHTRSRNNLGSYKYLEPTITSIWPFSAAVNVLEGFRLVDNVQETQT
jgi:hypothetical protein